MGYSLAVESYLLDLRAARAAVTARKSMRRAVLEGSGRREGKVKRCAPEHTSFSVALLRGTHRFEQWVSPMSRTALNQISQDHQEAVRLSRMSRHVPVGAIVIVGFALLNIASAIASILE
jgi:hypothetical protein